MDSLKTEIPQLGWRKKNMCVREYRKALSTIFYQRWVNLVKALFSRLLIDKLHLPQKIELDIQGLLYMLFPTRKKIYIGYSGAVGGKIGKTSVLPGFSKIECGRWQRQLAAVVWWSFLARACVLRWRHRWITFEFWWKIWQIRLFFHLRAYFFC